MYLGWSELGYEVRELAESYIYKDLQADVRTLNFTQHETGNQWVILAEE